jgi:outer membrane receptor protein involved in Fe transport
MISTLAGFALKTLKAKYNITAMHLQNGESSAGIFDFINDDEGSYFTGYQHNLSYSQKSISNLHMAAKYKFEEAKWDLEWKLSPTFSRIKDPDIRFTRYENIDGGVRISTETGFPERIWRDLYEINGVALVAAKKSYEAFGSKAELKVGSGYSYKQRDFSIKNFQVNVRGDIPLTGDPDELFQDENLWPYLGNPSEGTTIETPFLPSNPNSFNSNISNISAYVSNQATIGKKFKSIIGLRTEYYTHRYTGQDQLGTNVLNNDKVLENLGLFPSVNLVYSVTENQNIRLSYGKTIARPSFKELSYAEIFDPITGRTFVGGLFRDADNATGVVYWDGELTSTNIHNFDFRWEIFPSKGRTVSISAFYKKFINPIEIIQYATQPGAFQPRNVGDGQVLGGEFEIRENLSWISKKTEAFDFVLNVTVVDSRIELSKTEYDSRVANARTGQVIEAFRKMAGQAPYIINGGFSYNGAKKGFFSNLQAGLFYNVQGETLQFAGIADRPDIYTVPFHSLNFNINKSFGKGEIYSIGIRVSNCLNDRRESIFKSFNAEDQYFSQLSPGVSSRIRFRVNL